MLKRFKNILSNMSVNNKFSAIIIIIVTLWMLSGVFFPKHPEPHSEQIRGGLEHMVRIVESQAVPKLYRLSYDAITSAKERVMLIAQARGKITSIPVESGALLRAGDVIINIEDAGASANLKNAQAALKVAQLQARAARELYRQNLSSKYDLDKANEALRRAEVGVRTAQFAAKNLQVVAPYAGYLDKLLVKTGDVLVDMADKPRILVGEFANMESITATISISANDAQKLRQFGTGEAQIVLPDGRGRAAKLTFLAKVAEASSNTFVVEFQAENKDLAMLSGQNIKIMPSLGERMAHKVPQYSLTIDDEGNPCVKAIDAEGVVQIYRNFELIDEDTECIWLSNLPEKLQLIVVGQGYVKAGARLDPAKVARQS